MARSWLPTTVRNPSGASATPGNSAGGLVAELLVDHVAQWLATAKAFELFDEQLHRLIEPVRRVVCAMGRQKDVFERIEGMTGGQRLLIENIQGRSPYPAVGERAN